MMIKCMVVMGMLCGTVMGDEYYYPSEQPPQIPSECHSFHDVQTRVDISLLTGWWYGEELIEHQNKSNTPFTSCMKLYISNRETTVIPNIETDYGIHSTTERPNSDESNYDLAGGRPRIDHIIRHSVKYLRITWTQESGPTIYNVRYTDPEHNHGIWTSFYLTGSPVKDRVIKPLDSDAGPEPPLYTEEVIREPTTILVMKAVGTHLTLTICQPSGFIKTVTVSRKPNTLKDEDVESIHRILKKRGVTTAPSTRLCQLGYTPSAAICSTKPSITLAVFLIAKLFTK